MRPLLLFDLLVDRTALDLLQRINLILFNIPLLALIVIIN